MNEPKFTPGDWRAHKGTDQWYVHVEQYGGVCSLLIGREDEANAHLIAASPRLYAALDACDKFLREQDEDGYTSESRFNVAAEARAALKDARGES